MYRYSFSSNRKNRGIDINISTNLKTPFYQSTIYYHIITMLPFSKLLAVATALLGFLPNVYAQEIFSPEKNKLKLEAAPINTTLKIDGFINEAEWSQAHIIDNFIQADPQQGQTARRKTAVRLLYNKKYLYVSAVCYDTVGRNNFRVLNMRRDYRASQNDFFAFAIDGYNDERNCAMFMLNPYGAQRDLLSFDDNYYEPDWDGLWIGRTQRTDTAWIAEFAIPWKTLRYKAKEDSLQTWGISFARLARSINETSYFPQFPRAYGGLRMPYAAKLVNLPAPKPSLNIRIQPYLLYSHNKSSNTLANNTIKPGGEVKWAINTNTLLDLTFNTDFAQADVDRKVINTNRFSVFYPERRQFFLENSGVFAVGMEPLANDYADFSTRIQPFFSRSIGLDASGNPLNIVAGGRLVYRSENRNYGGLFIRQEGNSQTRAANFFVGRYSQNIGKHNRMGVLLSYKSLDNNADANNLTYTLDGFMRFKQRLSLSYMLSGTNTGGSKNGIAGAMQMSYTTNQWSAWCNESLINKDYKPAVGFVARENTIVSEVGLTRQFRGSWLPKYIRAYVPGFSLTTYHNASNTIQTDRYFNISPLAMQFQSGGIVSWNWIFFKQNLESNTSLLNTTINKGVYYYNRHRITFSTDPSKKFSLSASGNMGDYYGGKYSSIATSITIAPIPHVYFSANTEFGETNQLGESKDSKRVNLYSIENRLAINPRVQLSSLFQKSSINNSVGWNIRFSWEVKPLSYIYLVFNSNTINDLSKQNDQAFISKISYLKQF